jgi:hypothetical protein
MKLYLSSYRIPTPNDLAQLLGKLFNEVSVALVPFAILPHLDNPEFAEGRGIKE